MSIATGNTMRSDSDVHALMMLLFYNHNNGVYLKEGESRFPFLIPWALLGTSSPAEVMQAFSAVEFFQFYLRLGILSHY